MDLVGYLNANWAICHVDRRSVGTYCVFLKDKLVSWLSSKQKVVARSSDESEYRALSSLVAKVKWIRLLSKLGSHLKHPLNLYCDNINAIYLSQNPIMYQ